MNKLHKAFKAIIEIIKKPYLLNKILDDDSVWEEYIIKKYDRKHGLNVVDINSIAPDFSENLEYFAFLDGGSLPTDIALLKKLIPIYFYMRKGKCQYFEIGTWRGESVVNVADTADKCYTLCLSKQELLSLGFPERYADLHSFFSKDKKNIIQLTGNSLTFDFKGLDKKFDLIFIDGNHHYDFVKNDTEKVFKHLIHENSIIVWHDYAYNPERYRPEIMAAILDGTPAEYRKNIYHVSNTMTAIFTREDIQSEELVVPVIPNKVFKVSIQNNKL